MRLAIFLVIFSILKISTAEFNCNLQPKDGSTTYKIVDYSAQCIYCFETGWNDYIVSKIDVILKDLIYRVYFPIGLGTLKYWEFFSKYSFLSISAAEISYNTTYYPSLYNSLINAFSLTSLYDTYAGKVFYDKYHPIGLLGSDAVLAIHQAKIDNSLTSDDCDMEVVQQFIESSDIVINQMLKCVNAEVDFDLIYAEINILTANWNVLHNTFLNCVKGITGPSATAKNCVLNAAKTFSTNLALLQKPITNLNNIAASFITSIPPNIDMCIGALEDTVNVEKSNIKTALNQCLGSSSKPGKVIRKIKV